MLKSIIILLSAAILSGCAYSQHERVTEFPNGSTITVRSTYIVAAPMLPPANQAEGFSGLQPPFRQQTQYEAIWQ